MSQEDGELNEESPNKRRKLSRDGLLQIETHMDGTEHSKDDVKSQANGRAVTSIEDAGTEATIPRHSNQNSKLEAGESESETSQQEGDGISLRDPSPAPTPNTPLSKNQLKKLRKKAEWEAGRESRKIKRKEKIRDKRERKKAAKAAEAVLQQQKGESPIPPTVQPTAKTRGFARLPVTFLIDCGFDDLMAEKERISLASQITRCYSDNHHAPFQAHMYVSSWSGKLRERFETVLGGHYRSWKDVKFFEERFVDVAKKASEAMRRNDGGRMGGAFARYCQDTNGQADSEASTANGTSTIDADETQKVPVSSSEESPRDEVIYLTPDSPHTLTSLSPYTVYIIGGLVDKNRHKGLCYKTATSTTQNIQTAKLPIGEYMEMTSRKVLAVNHVFEIMLRYLESGSWGDALGRVVPARKGGRLRDKGNGGEGPSGEVKVDKEDEDDVEEHGDGDGGAAVGNDEGVEQIS